MSFDLHNATQTSQQFIAEVTRGLDSIFACIDDIMVISDSADHLRQLFELLEGRGMTVKDYFENPFVNSITTHTE